MDSDDEDFAVPDSTGEGDEGDEEDVVVVDTKPKRTPQPKRRLQKRRETPPSSEGEGGEGRWLCKGDLKEMLAAKKAKRPSPKKKAKMASDNGDCDDGTTKGDDGNGKCNRRRLRKTTPAQRPRSRQRVDTSESEGQQEDGPKDDSGAFFKFLAGWTKAKEDSTKQQKEKEKETPVVAKALRDEEEDSEEETPVRAIRRTKTPVMGATDESSREQQQQQQQGTPEPRRRLQRIGEVTPAQSPVPVGDEVVTIEIESDEGEDGRTGTTKDNETEDDSEGSEKEDHSLEGILRMCEDCSARLREFLERCRDHITSGAVADEATTYDAEEGKEPQPKSMNGSLRGYQIAGMNWMYLLSRFGMNGILADEMGLGKTVQAISLLALLQSKGNEGPHLVVVPATTLENWSREIAMWCPSLTVLTYYGTLKQREALREATPPNQMRHNGEYEPTYNVLLTTYAIATSKYDRGYLKKCRFSFFIVDEAQNVKNSSSRRFEKLVGMPAERRLLLTGTPLQNNLVELWALLRFLLPDVIESSSAASMLHRQVFAGDEAQRIERLKVILSPFFLRRLKCDVAGDVTAKKHVTVECPMPPWQMEHYEELVAKSKVQWHKASAADSVSPDCELMEASMSESAQVQDQSRSSKHQPASLLSNIVMELRKMANHPLLCRAAYSKEQLAGIASAVVTAAARNGYGNTELRRFIGVSAEDVAREFSLWSDFEIHSLCCRNESLLGQYRLKEEQLFESAKLAKLVDMLSSMLRSKRGKKVLVFSQMTRVLDIIEVAITLKEWRYLRLDGSTPVSERMRLVDKFNNDPDVGIFLLSTRAAGLGINLTSADTVVFYDNSFNPQVDRQAEDRCHRLGQEKEVTIYRLIATGTIDSYMHDMAVEKLRLHDKVLDEGEWSASAPSSEKQETKHWMTKMVTSIFGGASPHKRR